MPCLAVISNKNRTHGPAVADRESQSQQPVGSTGFEPARPFGHKALNLARLPISPRALDQLNSAPSGRIRKSTRRAGSVKRRAAGRAISRVAVAIRWNGSDCNSGFAPGSQQARPTMTSTDTKATLVAVDIGNSRIKVGRFEAASTAGFAVGTNCDAWNCR